MDNKGIRPGVWLAVLGSLAALVVILALLNGRTPPAEQRPTSSAATTAGDAPAAAVATKETAGGNTDKSAREQAESRRAPAAAPAAAPEYIDGLVYGEIDLREARALMPDNMYWKFASPTKDEKILAEREEETRRRNEEYGKVLSGDASEEEVKAYYDYRKRMASDYYEFAEFMSRRYKNSDNEQFRGLLDLAMKMNAQRLAQLPEELADALQRAIDRAKVREDWQRQQQEFGKNGGLPVEDPEQ
jgi:hypothetical protein